MFPKLLFQRGRIVLQPRMCVCACMSAQVGITHHALRGQKLAGALLAWTMWPLTPTRSSSHMLTPSVTSCTARPGSSVLRTPCTGEKTLAQVTGTLGKHSLVTLRVSVCVCLRLTESSAGVAEQLQSTRIMAEDLMEAQSAALQAQQEILENGEELKVTLRDSAEGSSCSNTPLGVCLCHLTSDPRPLTPVPRSEDGLLGAQQYLQGAAGGTL